MQSTNELTSSLATFTIARLVTVTATSASALYHIANTVEGRYRFGELGFVDGKVREIAAPSMQLKRIQRAISDELRRCVSVPDAVCSVVGRGVRWGASRHLGQPFISIRDLQRAFPTTTCARVHATLIGAGMPPDAESLVRRLVTVRGSIPQGAPSSNVILDLVLSSLDAKLQSLSDSYDARYTRFADDLTFSASRPLDEMMPLIDAAVDSDHYALKADKSWDYGEKDLKIVTGIVIGGSLTLPPSFVADTKRLIAEAHRGNWQASRRQLDGRLAWISSFDALGGAALRKELRQIRNLGGRFPAKRTKTLRFRGQVTRDQ